MYNREDKIHKSISFVKKSTAIVGPILPGVLTLLNCDPKYMPLCTVLGAGFPIILDVLADISTRNMSYREELRTSASAVFALNKMYYYYDHGGEIRSDNFFKSINNTRSDMEELLEGVLMQARDEYQEKKIKFTSNILASAVFREDLSKEEVNYMISVAQTLTYRQICLLALFLRKNSISELALREINYDDANEEIFATISNDSKCTLQEIFALYNLGLLYQKDPGESNWDVIYSASGVAPNKILLTDLGKRLSKSMDLFEVTEDDIIVVSKFIS